jgi:predicted DNA-binding transcriptional regulator YafY
MSLVRDFGDNATNPRPHMTQIDRLYSYRALFNSRRFVPRQEILQRFEISPATFKRDLAKLRDRLNVPIVFDAALGGYRLDTTAGSQELPGVWLNSDEILALMTIQHMIEQLEPGMLGPKLKPLQHRLDDMLASQGVSATTLATRVKVVHAGKRRLPLKAFEVVAKATLERRQLRMVHLNRRTAQSVARTVSPQQLVHYRDNWYVDAWCHLRNELRSFAVDAIAQCKMLDKEAIEVDAEQMDTLKAGYGIFGGAVQGRAQLLFNAERARWVQHEEWHPEQTGTLNADGSYLLEVPYSDARELVGDILRYGADVRVLGPEGLVDAVRRVVEQAYLNAFNKP